MHFSHMTQLISLVLNFTWFNDKTMSPCFRELQDQITEQATSASQRDEHLVEVQANCTVVQHTLAHGNEKLYTHCVQCQSYTELYWTPWLPPPGVFRGHFGVVLGSLRGRFGVKIRSNCCVGVGAGDGMNKLQSVNVLSQVEDVLGYNKTMGTTNES